MLREFEYEPFAMETITVTSGNASVGLTSNTYSPPAGGLPARRALITVDTGANIRYTLDGTTVGTATGHVLTIFNSYIINGHQGIRNFSTTSFSSGTTGRIVVTYFR